MHTDTEKHSMRVNQGVNTGNSSYISLLLHEQCAVVVVTFSILRMHGD